MGKPENEIAGYLVRMTERSGGMARKVRWEGRRGAPDWALFLPKRISRVGPVIVFPAELIWVETKAPGGAVEPHQIREHTRLRRYGQRVVVIDNLEDAARLLHVVQDMPPLAIGEDDV